MAFEDQESLNKGTNKSKWGNALVVEKQKAKVSWESYLNVFNVCENHGNGYTIYLFIGFH